MATASTGKYGEFRITVESDITPGVYALICGLTTKGIQFNSDVVTSEVPDCSNEDLPSWQEKDIKSVGCSLSGSGMWAKESHEQMLQWIMNGTKKNVKVQYPAAVGDVEYLSGPCVCTAVGTSVEKGGRMTAEISLEFSAKPTTTDKP